MTSLTLVSLFDGVAGFPLAFSRAGVRTVAMVEIDAAASAIATKHFPDAVHFTDVCEVTGDDFRAAGFVPARGIVAAGFPCQDVSVAGRRGGLAGARTGLFWEIVRVLADLRPRWVVLENVPGLLSSNAGADMGAVLGALGELGYGFAYRVLDAQFFGVPQRRRRVFIVGALGDWAAPVEVLLEPEGGEGDSASREPARPDATADAVRSVATPCGAGIDTHTHTHTQELCCVDVAGRWQPGIPDRRRSSSGRTPHRRQAVAALTANGVGTCGPDDNQAQAGHLVVSLAVAGDFSSSENVAQTVRAAHGQPGVIGHDTVVRRLTPRECERLQGFPDNWTAGQKDSPRYKQMGNSLAIPVVEWIAHRIVAVDGAS